ncbi:MAG TPA: NAD-dependent epimerase/dehydratase family protein [Longimicrobiales bacterium]|nr:NAD-dependent epimerase/dehydratase family protein [Longimicrobiales bacterium]
MSGSVVFLTGATGFIGSRIARGLAAGGARLRCLVRSPASRAARSLEELGAELIPGDVNDPAALEHGLGGADLAYHIAAIYDIGVVDEAALEATNVDGTRAFLRAAQHARTPRVIYVSSTVALGPVAPDSTGDDQPPYAGPYPSIYHRTKSEAHRIAVAAQQSGQPVLIACPAYVYGPGDEGPAGKLIEDLLRRRVPTLIADPAWYSFVHVDDVAEALIALADRGTADGVYVLGGENERFDRFVQQVAELGNVFAPRPITPAPLARGIGRTLDAVARRTGVRFPLSLEGVNVVTRGRYTFGHARAARELGFTPRSLAAGLPETVAFFRAKLARGRRTPGA